MRSATEHADQTDQKPSFLKAIAGSTCKIVGFASL